MIKKQRLAAIEYIRGISMLGVIGIHTGSQYLGNPFANIHLIAIFEIFTRFSVPIFFFISAFGLFYGLDPQKKFNYKTFITRRFKAVLIPYLIWSALYLLHYAFIYRDFSPWTWPFLPKFLFFGLASYQLYFLVIMLWFYILMPVWLFMIKHMTKSRLTLLLLLQIAFDYYSSYLLPASAFPNFFKPFIEYRLNYWVLHYLFIFLLGAYAAAHYEKFSAWLKTCFHKAALFFVLSLSALLGHYYYLIFCKNYSPESAINTAHQLSPLGIFYTVAASLFFFALFSYKSFPQKTANLLSLLGKHSYFAYLFHPFAIFYLTRLLHKSGLLMTGPASLVFYALTAACSILAAIACRKLGAHFPLLNALLIGVCPKKSQK